MQWVMVPECLWSALHITGHASDVTDFLILPSWTDWSANCLYFWDKRYQQYCILENHYMEVSMEFPSTPAGSAVNVVAWWQNQNEWRWKVDILFSSPNSFSLYLPKQQNKGSVEFSSSSQGLFWFWELRFFDVFTYIDQAWYADF